jgi:tetratricopeptide (TPR) repeat protein
MGAAHFMCAAPFLVGGGAAFAGPGPQASPGATVADKGPQARAEALLDLAEAAREAGVRFQLADQAEVLLGEAARVRPLDPMPRVLIARALSLPDPDHPESCRPRACERAIVELKKGRELAAAGPLAARVASELGIVLSRVGRFDEALKAYDDALGLVDGERQPGLFEDGNGRAVLYGNSAETLMALGRLPQSIARYEKAEAAAYSGGAAWQLAQWGLGVALDRDEQIERSREAIKRALEKDPTMARLTDEGVFFEPPGDKRYYEALGHEVAGDVPEAISAYKAFLAALPSSRWLGRARAHLAELERAPVAGGGPLRVTLLDPLVLRSIRPAAQLRTALLQHTDEIRLCLDRAQRTDPRLRRMSGLLRLGLDIQPAGWVGPHARVISSSVDSAELERCIELAAASWRFAPLDGNDSESVVLPIQLGPP